MDKLITLDDRSPLVSYVGDWVAAINYGEGAAGDPNGDKYFNRTWHYTTDFNGYATISWTGTQINVLGAYRVNHGYYSISLDSAAKVYVNGQSTNPQMQVSIYNASNLAYGDHTLVLANEPTYKPPDILGDIYFDIDYIMIDGPKPPSDTGKVDTTPTPVVDTTSITPVPSSPDSSSTSPSTMASSITSSASTLLSETEQVATSPTTAVYVGDRLTATRVLVQLSGTPNISKPPNSALYGSPPANHGRKLSAGVMTWCICPLILYWIQTLVL